jgi:hypothetical protein
MPDAHEAINRIAEGQIGQEPLVYTLYTQKELANLDIPPTQWIVPMMIPNPGLVIVSGRPGSYKTWFATWIGLRASAGLPLFDECDQMFFSRPSPLGKVPTLFIEEEMAKPSMKERACCFQAFNEASDMLYMVDDGFKFKDEAWQAELIKVVEEKKVKLLILDPFSSVMGLEDENNNSEVAKVMDIIRKVFIKAGLTVILLHHPAKGDGGGRSIRGAGDILGKCDVHLCLEKEEEGEFIRTVSIRFEKMRLAPEDQVKNFKMHLHGSNDHPDRQFIYIGEATKEKKKKKGPEGLTTQILSVMKDNEAYEQKWIAKMVGQKPNNSKFQSAWKSLCREDVILQDPKTKTYYRSLGLGRLRAPPTPYKQEPYK